MTRSFNAEALTYLKNRCNTNKVRLTQQRRKVYDVLLSAERALSAYELTKLYNSRFSRKIIATSVYRILDFLIEMELAYRLETINKFIASAQSDKRVANSASYYFPIFVICVNCEDVSELSVPYSLMHQMKKIADSPQFKVIDSKIELKGLCTNCEPTFNANQKGVQVEKTIRFE
uniref:Fur family transcriptional regulator n=1 Tax=Ningiella ruwaisensis TaxID=2364274 RepID=UPI0010A06CFA|nr:transcriptional repressor [Ningiella ruwaisensis]